MSDSVQPHRRQPTRLPRPWDSPGKNTGVGCHFLLQCINVKCEREVAQSYPTLSTLWTAAYQAPPPMGFSRHQTQLGLAGSSVLGLTRVKSSCPPAVVPSDAQGPLLNSVVTGRISFLLLCFPSGSLCPIIKPVSTGPVPLMLQISPTSLSAFLFCQLEKILCSWGLL